MKEYHSLSPGGGGTHTHSGPRSAVIFRLMRSCILQGHQGRSVGTLLNELPGHWPPQSGWVCCRILECHPSRLCPDSQDAKAAQKAAKRQHGTLCQEWQSSCQGNGSMVANN